MAVSVREVGTHSDDPTEKQTNPITKRVTGIKEKDLGHLAWFDRNDTIHYAPRPIPAGYRPLTEVNYKTESARYQQEATEIFSRENQPQDVSWKSGRH